MPREKMFWKLNEGIRVEESLLLRILQAIINHLNQHRWVLGESALNLLQQLYLIKLEFVNPKHANFEGESPLTFVYSKRNSRDQRRSQS